MYFIHKKLSIRTNVCYNKNRNERSSIMGRKVVYGMAISEHFRYMEPPRGARPSKDLTFKFYTDGKLEIIDNDSGSTISPRELSGGSYDFYVRQRLAFIKRDLCAKIAKYA